MTPSNQSTLKEENKRLAQQANHLRKRYNKATDEAIKRIQDDFNRRIDKLAPYLKQEDIDYLRGKS